MSTPPLVRQSLVTAYQCALLWHSGDIQARTVVLYVFGTVCGSAQRINGESRWTFAADGIIRDFERISERRRKAVQPRLYRVKVNVPEDYPNNHAGRPVGIGEVFPEYLGSTFGCCDDENGVVLAAPDGSFFEFPRDAVEEL